MGKLKPLYCGAMLVHSLRHWYHDINWVWKQKVQKLSDLKSVDTCQIRVGHRTTSNELISASVSTERVTLRVSYSCWIIGCKSRGGDRAQVNIKAINRSVWSACCVNLTNQPVRVWSGGQTGSCPGSGLALGCWPLTSTPPPPNP